MILTYVNFIGKIKGGLNIYEFYFSDFDKLGEIFEEQLNWDIKPALGRPEAPENTSKTLYLLTDIELELLKDNGVFKYNDGVYGTIAILWSNEPIWDSTLNIFFGEEEENVKKKLFKYNLTLKENVI